MGEPRPAALPALFVLVVLALAAIAPAALPAADRVPRPEFTTGYEQPSVQTPAPRSGVLEYLDVAVLAACLALSGWLAIRARSREGIFLLSVFSIAYFGFFRKGCICPIGAIQNIALALVDPSYAVPRFAVAFFVLPLATALATGRTFCAAVCPFGALQDALIVKPLRLPRWLAVPLGFLPVVYLGLAVLFAATGAEFIVCRFDPFVNFFRVGGSIEILALGACFLLLGTVVARPYCRFVCPYGVILGWLSRLSFLHATISPDSCVQCRLCEEACPVGAIRAPDPQGIAARSPPTRGEKRALAAALIAVPVLVAAGAGAGSLLAPLLARVHPAVRLEIQVLREDAGLTDATTLESDAFRTTETTVEELSAEASAIRRRFTLGGPLLGGFVMLVATLSILATFPRRKREEYQPDRGECVSCGRCFSHCPREHLRRKERGP
jgi:NosR/NirI family transcriptional regulator, nitrous oxide reductase regulator